MSEIGKIDWTAGSVRDVRNRIRIYYGVAVLTDVERAPETWFERVSAWFGAKFFEKRLIRPSVTVEDVQSIARLGLRYMEVEGKEEWTEKNARTLAESALRDLTITPL